MDNNMDNEVETITYFQKYSCVLFCFFELLFQLVNFLYCLVLFLFVPAVLLNINPDEVFQYPVFVAAFEGKTFFYFIERLIKIYYYNNTTYRLNIYHSMKLVVFDGV